MTLLGSLEMLRTIWWGDMIKRATFFIITIGGPHDCTLQLNVSWEKLHNFEFGRYDFLYSGAFWGWPLPKKSSRIITYVRYVNWTNIHSFHVFHAQTAFFSIFISAKGSHTSSFNEVKKLKNSGPTLSATTQWTQTQQAVVVVVVAT